MAPNTGPLKGSAIAMNNAFTTCLVD